MSIPAHASKSAVLLLRQDEFSANPEVKESKSRSFIVDRFPVVGHVVIYFCGLPSS